AQPWQWAAESYAIAIRPETLYCFQQAGTCRYSPTQATYTGGAERTQALTPAYLDRAAPIVRDRLSRAGIRLADALNRALDPGYHGPAVPLPGQTLPPPPPVTTPPPGGGPAAGPGDDLPNVPGAINPDVTQDNINSTICVSGWTSTIRPKVSYTNALKRELMARYKLSGNLSDYELDHLVSLEIGGHPKSRDNLWMEHWSNPRGARMKDALETKLKRLVCAGTIPLSEAQQAIMTNWVAAYDHYVGAVPAAATGHAKRTAKGHPRKPAHRK